MKFENAGKVVDALKNLLYTKEIEKLILKALACTWLLLFIVIALLSVITSARSDIEKKLMDAATGVKYMPKGKAEFEKYEAILTREKYPEESAEYTRYLKRDPFAEYKELVIKPEPAAQHNFELASIERLPLPLVYKGFIELEDRVIGQINWREATKFVEPGSKVNGYTILSVSKESLAATDEGGRKRDFKLNKVVLGDELKAVLYDSGYGQTYSVQLASEIDDYKVVDIREDYLVLLYKGEQIKLTK